MNETQTSDRRVFRRQQNSSSIRVDWQDEAGSPQTLDGRCVDISAGGLSFESMAAIPTDTTIQFKVPELHLCGKGVVRYSADAEGLFRVAIAFTAVEWDVFGQGREQKGDGVEQEAG